MVRTGTGRTNIRRQPIHTERHPIDVDHAASIEA